MRKVNATEMRTIEGGATVTKTCRYCGYKITGSSLLKALAQIWVGNKMHEHEVHCLAKKAGL